MGKAYIFLADGFEETEALTTLDILRRGKIEAYTVSITEDIYVTSSHGITVVADMGRSDFSEIDIDEKDAMIFPGGMPGSKKLAADTPLIGLMNVHYEGGGLVAAICAAPGLVATQLKGIEGKKATCFDGFEENLAASGMEYGMENNFSAYIENVDGVVATGSTIQELKANLLEALDVYVEACKENGCDLPKELKKSN